MSYRNPQQLRIWFFQMQFFDRQIDRRARDRGALRISAIDARLIETVAIRIDDQVNSALPNKDRVVTGQAGVGQFQKMLFVRHKAR
jgi:hypothetical protein